MNIYDYLDWRGDLLIDDFHPINEVDKLILARISYLPFDHITFYDGMTLEEACKRFMRVLPENYLWSMDIPFASKLLDSPRFNQLKLTDYSYHYDKDAEQQFGAVAIHLDEKLIYLSYLGTDSKIAGWKEDFNLCYLENVPSQLDALDYLLRMNLKYRKAKFMLGGHSKGGNVAVYAGLMYEKDNILSVDSYDGPGFMTKFYRDVRNPENMKKTTIYLPKDSIVGRILHHKEKVVVVDSSVIGIWQHDIFSWIVDKNSIKREKLTRSSDVINDTLDRMLDYTTPAQRKIFFDTVFSLIYSTGKDDFKEISIIRNIPVIISSFNNLDAEDKKLVAKLALEFVKTYANVYGKDKFGRAS